MTIGVFIILFFPFDIYRFFTESNLTFTSWNYIPIPNLSILSSGFQPLINLNYLKLDNIASGLAFILFFALLVGAVAYCSIGILQWANSKLSYLLRIIFKATSESKKENKKNWGNVASTMDFQFWVQKHHLEKYFTYIATMREVATAFLYGSELLVLVTLLSGIFVEDKTLWLGWSIIMILIFVSLATIYESYEPSYWRTLNSFANHYKDSEICD